MSKRSKRLTAMSVFLIAAATGAGTATASSRSDPEPYVVLSESTGPAGTELTAFGCGWLPKLSIQVSHPGLVEVGPPSSNNADAGGCFSKQFRVAEGTPPGYVTITYRQAENINAQASFQVQAK